MTKRQWIWGSLCLLTLIIFFILIPIDTYDANRMVLTILAGFLFSGTLFFTLGDFTSIGEITSRTPPHTPENSMRKLAPLAVIPGIFLIFILFFYHSSRKKDELSKHGVLTKGTVVGGEATETTRRFQKNTSYSLIVAYRDSNGVNHNVDQSVDSYYFNNTYKGATVDVIYSSELPGLASALFSVEELRKYKKVPNGDLHVDHLVALMESIPSDSILHFLNSINYEWEKNSEGFYVNNKLDLAIKIFPENAEIAYAEQSNLFSGNSSKFEKTLTNYGFKKKSTSTQGQETEIYYYNDKYGIIRERNVSENRDNGMYSSTVTLIYHLFDRSSASE